MTDFHSHILPGIDDGSASVEESCAMLRMLEAQGITKVIATPHFYPNRTSLDRFIERRRASLELLKPTLTDGMPRILLGAEVNYYDGIRRMEGLERLCIEGSRVLLLEMPFERWSEMTLNEVSVLSRSGKVKVVLAHIDRYISYQAEGDLERLLESGVLFQMNASYFI
ncbi:MAG: CpsB/CapC family capsule biosynthesis tyrosine phosphatase, partial [Eubacteriales bacterium]